MDIHELARQNQQSAWKVLEDTRIIEAWERIGATVHLVGSLRTGLLAKSRDIDIHIYTDRLDVGESFSVIRELAERLPLQEIQYRNDTDTMLWGYPKETMQWLFESGSRGAGYMLSICRYGLIGTIVSVLFYFVYVLMSKDKKFAFCCLLFIVLIYLQRSYPFWFSWIICFIYGITSNYYTSKMRYNK